MNYLVAVSGGVDSVVLLDMLARKKSYDITVAHFEHGIRGEESVGDQRFVEDLAGHYGLEFVTMNAQLGAKCSEATARAARYEFLLEQAAKIGAQVATAHHADDVIETIAINLTRGTGWRGLAVMDGEIYRPLLHTLKREILDYAATHQLKWREDSTNLTDDYLRNRLRKKLASLDDDVKFQLLALRDTQVTTKRSLDGLLATNVCDSDQLEREVFTNIDDTVADELIRSWCLKVANVAPPRPARARILEAIRSYTPGKVHQSTDHIDVMVEKRFVNLRYRA